MKKNFPYWTTLAASAAVCIAAFVFRHCAARLCGGEFIYPIDDAYIHIAMARNLALHGVWGIEPSAPAFCSSSPLWTVLLASLYAVFGVSEMLPWHLALVFNLGVVALTDLMLLRLGARWFVRIPSAVAVAVAAPFFCTTALGMEHAMHAFFLLAVVWALAKDSKDSPKQVCLVCVMAFCATGSRYESLFFLLPMGALLIAMKRIRMGLLLLSAAVAPVALYGCCAVCTGGHLLPNSLLLKGQFSTLGEVVVKTLRLIVQIPDECGFLYLLSVPLLTAIVIPGVGKFWRIAAGSMIVALAGHMVFASAAPQLCRYEAYLTAGGAAIAIVAFAAAGRRHVAWNGLHALALAVALTALGVRAYEQVPAVAWSSEDIYSQQVQMTRMMSELPDERKGCVAINDLGYTSLHIGAPVLDVWGLGSQDMTEDILANGRRWSPRMMQEALVRHKARYMVVYEQWFPLAGMPKGTIPVAFLHLAQEHICGSNLVAFRAFNPSDAEFLANHLAKYADRLPRRAALKVVWQPEKPLCAL